MPIYEIEAIEHDRYRVYRDVEAESPEAAEKAYREGGPGVRAVDEEYLGRILVEEVESVRAMFGEDDDSPDDASPDF